MFATSACGVVDESGDESSVVVSGLPLTDYPSCTELGGPLVDHASFHATMGPYATVAGSPLRDFASGSPNVNTVHTQFTVTLPGSPGANEATVKYRPARTGDWSFFSNPPTTVQILDASGSVVPIELQHNVTRCPQLPRVVIARLTGGATCRFMLGPSPFSSVAVVAEKLTDFENALLQRR